jgi:predicted ATPase
LGQLSVITGANGSGKSSVYRALRLLADVAQNAVVSSLAREGGLSSTFWAGPEMIARSVREGTHPVEGLAKRKVASLKLGFGGDTYGYSIDLGYPPPGLRLRCLEQILESSASACGMGPSTGGPLHWSIAETTTSGSRPHAMRNR